MASRRDIEQLKKDAQKQGWKVELTRGGHLAWVSPLGEKTFSAQSPSDHRAIKNVIKELTRRGYVPKGLRGK